MEKGLRGEMKGTAICYLLKLIHIVDIIITQTVIMVVSHLER